MNDASNRLKQTPLTGFHQKLGARMVPFAAYSMPLQYSAGILAEHLHTRANAGLFDVSHMGQIDVWPLSGSVTELARALEKLVPADVVGLPEGRQRYALFTNVAGGILDDLMIANRGDHLSLIVNASRKDADEAWLREHLSRTATINRLDSNALLALQGPAAEAALSRLSKDTAHMRFMDVRTVSLLGTKCEVSRSGYTGEDGYEISVPGDKAEALASALLDDISVKPVGLGARDSLRLEAGLCLYGQDITEATSPVEAALEWSIPKSRRAGGARPGGFPGANNILSQLEHGASRRRVGLQVEGKAPIRTDAKLFGNACSPIPIGFVSSGSFGASVKRPIAMGYVPIKLAKAGTSLSAELRGERVPLEVCDLPFVSPRYKRQS